VRRPIPLQRGLRGVCDVAIALAKAIADHLPKR
jgi:hypothetical protein